MDNDKNTTQAIKEAYQDLPQEVKDAVTASDLPTKMKTVANNHNLLLDKVGILQNEILFVMLGLEPSSDFVGNISRELGVDQKEAVSIATDVNQLIFSPIRTYLQKWEKEAEQEEVEQNDQNKLQEQQSANNRRDISAVEQAGDFSVDQERPDDSGSMNGTIEKKDAILRGIEEPKPVPEVIPTNLPTAPLASNTDPLIDRMMSGAVSVPEQKIVKGDKPKPPEPPKKKYEADPYHEPVN